MEKITGQKLKKDIIATKQKLSNLQGKASKRFILILDEYSQYIPEPYKSYLQNNSYLDMGLYERLEVIIATEAEYVKQTGKQTDLFN